MNFISKNPAPVEFIKIKDIFHELASDVNFVKEYKQAYANIKTHGALKAIDIALR